MLDALIALAPLLVLIRLMTRRHPMPAWKALPLAAGLLYLVKHLVWFRADPNLTHATVATGLLTAWTPILIVWGAIFLFRTMEHSGALDVLTGALYRVSPHRVRAS